MKYLKYLFLIVATITIADLIYLFFKPKASYQVFSFDVSFTIYAIFKLFIALSFILLALKKNEEKK
jgi:hypothetical protein